MTQCDQLRAWFLWRFWRLWYRFRFGYGQRCVNGLYFVKLGWLFFSGKLTLVTIEQSVSNGGYKYLDLVISKRPLSERNTYDDL